MPPKGEGIIVKWVQLNLSNLKKFRTIFPSDSLRKLWLLHKRQPTGLRGTMICGAYIAPCSDQTDKQKKIGKIYAFKVFAADLMEEGKKTK